MLDVALAFLVKELNAFLASRGFQGPDASEPGDLVALGRVVDEAGKYAVPINHAVASLVQVEEERTLKAQRPETIYSGGSQLKLEPELRLNMHLLFAVNFQHYETGLRCLAGILTFFQAHPSFDPERHPGLDPRIFKLSADLLPLGYEQLNQLWAFVGGKYLPSAVYRIRLLSLQDREPIPAAPPITSVEVEIQQR